MRRLLLTSVALAASTASALAADLPSRRAPPVFVPVVPVFTWTGAYLGVNAGYAFDNYQTYRAEGNQAATRALVAAGIAPSRATTVSDGFTGGGQIGYNFEIDGPGFAGLPTYGGAPASIVAGVEGDAAYTDLHRTGDVLTAGGAVDNRASGRVDFVGTARARLGVAFGTILLYGTGGFAYGGVRENVSASVGGTTLYSGSRDKLRGGTAYGGGVEYAIPTTSFVNVFHSSAVTLKGEFIHYDLGSEAMPLIGRGAATGTSFTSRVRVEGNLVRAGLNYKLDFSHPVPVVARY